MSELPAVATTFGVEEEYHLVSADSLELANRPALAARVLAAGENTLLKPEMLTSQLEAASLVCSTLDELHPTLLGMRAEAAAAAAAEGAVLLATSTHPFALLREIEVMTRPRYDVLLERFGTVVTQLNLCGCHVHVSVPDLDTAVAVMTLARPYLPLLAAITASSPYHEGVDTGYDSYRLAQLSLWAQGGPPPHLNSGADYLATVERLVSLGLVDDASAVLWELRPSARYPTLEFRIGDMCPDVLDVVLYTGIARSLVRTLAARTATTSLSDPELRAARWQAARYGLSDRLWSPARAEPTAAPMAMADLLAELRPDLEAHGEWDVVAELMNRLLRQGNAAARQRQVLAASGDVHEVAAAMVRLTAGTG
jgi:glutamate---cysteine ligase / carboxylate-amine ligase